MKLILGLGNYGTKYEKTRHNVGWLAVDFFRQQFDFPDFKLDIKLKALISYKNMVIANQEEKVILAKPTTFMNLSGEALALIKSFYKLNTVDIIIVYDDKDMEFGKIRTRLIGSSGGHNGIKSVSKIIGDEFTRVKIGVGDSKKLVYQDTADFVLSEFSKNELAELSDNILYQVVDVLQQKLLIFF